MGREVRAGGWGVGRWVLEAWDMGMVGGVRC